MNIKSKISKLVSGLLCFSMIFSNVLPAYAADAVITENTLDGEDLSVNERNLEDITVTYKQASSFFVTIPKTIVLDGWKQSTYAVKVSGDIDAEQCVYVAPVDGIADTENIDFYMKDQASENAKDDVVANVTHNKFHWNSAEVAAGHKQADNLVEAPDLTAGAWKGIFQMEIKLETHVTHKHNYVETITKEPTCTETGEKTYTCDCGDSYTEEIPAKGHHFEDGECTDCGEKDSDYHKHNYVETITKEPTCTETGEKTFTCDCGDSYTEVIPATGHHFVDGECEHCHEKDPDYHEHSYDDGVVTKEPTCVEAGEKTFTCSECGHTYTEEIPATGHNYENHICTNCGETDPSHVHNYIPYEFTVEPTLVSSVKNHTATAAREWALNATNDEYNSYYTAIIHPGSNQSKSCTTTATFEIDLPDDYEGEFDYKYGYVCRPNSSAALTSKKYVITMTINGSQVYRNYTGSISGAASSNTTIPLKAGKNTFTVQYSGYTTLSSYSVSDTSTATLTLYKCPLYDGTQYHICNECGKKEKHYFDEGVVTKEATCVETGEKTYTCNICDGKYIEEIPAKGHNYVNGICTICGDLNTGVEQIFNVSATTTKQSATSATNPDGHYEVTTLADTYSDNIEILEDMLDGEYLGINYYVYFPTLGGTAYYGESDNINGLWQVQKYNAETDVWENYYQKIINYDNIKGVEETEDRFNLIAPHGRCFFKKFKLETGTYRVHCRFYAKSGMCDSYNHPHYKCNVTASMCKVNKN